MMRELSGETMSGQRGSRWAKWIASTEPSRAKAGLEAPTTLKNLWLFFVFFLIVFFYDWLVYRQMVPRSLFQCHLFGL